MVTDIGELCTECRQSTEFGSGRFVNRIPSDNGLESGWMCEECQQLECDRCREGTTDYWYVDVPRDDGWYVQTVCHECITEAELKQVDWI
jgi:hypothetical protein